MDEVLEWLLAGDPAVRWQAQRELTGGDWRATRARVAHEGRGAQLLSQRRDDATWPAGWYSPKWVAETIEAWWPAIHTGYSNARSEGYNRLVAGTAPSWV